MWEPHGERIPSPELGTWFQEDRKRSRELEEEARRVRRRAAVVPYELRPVVGPKPVDPRNPWRHAGLMSDIGGVEGFVRVQRGTHRYPDGQW